ncbi:MAG: ribonuclease HI [Chloroflexi bacterium]|nr:ribonuclease HI [Chloroflexota bacterium]MYK34388.1 ribonuclease HI [Chloroflexota bacterium]
MPSSPQKTITIHTDGACLGNPGPGGYGAVLDYQGTRRELSGGFRLTTNNRMELLAVIVALEALNEPCQVTVHSDSKYVVDAVEQGWARRWKANGWKRNKKEAAINPDLWERLLQLTEKHAVTFRWVRGHAGNIENERCDRLAVEAANGRDLEVDSVYESSTTYGRVQMV